MWAEWGNTDNGSNPARVKPSPGGRHEAKQGPAQGGPGRLVARVLPRLVAAIGRSKLENSETTHAKGKWLLIYSLILTLMVNLNFYGLEFNLIYTQQHST